MLRSFLRRTQRHEDEDDVSLVVQELHGRADAHVGHGLAVGGHADLGATTKQTSKQTKRGSCRMSRKEHGAESPPTFCAHPCSSLQAPQSLGLLPQCQSKPFPSTLKKNPIKLSLFLRHTRCGTLSSLASAQSPFCTVKNCRSSAMEDRWRVRLHMEANLGK